MYLKCSLPASPLTISNVHVCLGYKGKVFLDKVCFGMFGILWNRHMLRSLIPGPDIKQKQTDELVQYV